MLEALLGVLAPVVDADSRFALEQFVSRRVEFFAETSQLDRERYAYKGRRIYRIFVRVAAGGPDVEIVSAGDAYNSGLTFFPATVENHLLPPSTDNCGPEVLMPSRGALACEWPMTADRDFVLFVATENALAVAYVDLRYRLMDAERRQRRTLLKVPMARNG